MQLWLQAGGRDLLKRSWKDLAEHIKVEVNKYALRCLVAWLCLGRRFQFYGIVVK